METPQTESHHLLPSGEWKGFYCYATAPTRHEMSMELIFKNGTVSGGGTDDIAPFSWKGTYDLDQFKIEMTKTYASHDVFYRGDIDENGIWGMWELDNQSSIGHFSESVQEIIRQKFRAKFTGGFHIWPKGKKNEQKETAEETEQIPEEVKQQQNGDY